MEFQNVYFYTYIFLWNQKGWTQPLGWSLACLFQGSGIGKIEDNLTSADPLDFFQVFQGSRVFQDGEDGGDLPP